MSSKTTSQQGEQISINLVYNEKISRLFIFRWLWVYAFMIPLYIWLIWILIIGFFHIFYKLILGKRKKSWWDKEVRFFKYFTRWNVYLQSLVDKHPKVIDDQE